MIRKDKVHYRPGWDCHGLPIELKASCSNKSDPSAVRKSARSFALATVEKHRKEFEEWGVIGDWRNESAIYKTTSPDYVTNQLDKFHEMFSKGLIFRDLKPVYWSVSSKTALAEAELEYDPNFKSPSLYFRVQVSNFPDQSPDCKYFALIWTTTPWTLPANQAISFNSSLSYALISFGNDQERYIVAESVLKDLQLSLKTKEISVISKINSDLSQLNYLHPLDASQSLPFIDGSHVSSSKGTGLVHTAPSHGFDDFLVCLRNNIPVKCIVDENGNYTGDAPGAGITSCNVLVDGNEAVLKLIDKNIVQLDEIIHSYPLDWRTKKPVFIRASHQWFINTEAIKDGAIKELQGVQIHPSTSADVNKQCLIDQLRKRPYWCISRQRVWGVPIPVYYHKATGAILHDQEILKRIQSRVLSEGNIDFWWSDEDNSQLLEGLVNDPSEYRRGQDILDIWFDSGVSWSYAVENNQVADMYLEGVDQFTGWFQSSLMTSVAVRGKAPYKNIFVHGFTVDGRGQKMSKSIGNTIEPKEIINKYGVDVLRWWVAAHSTQHSAIVVSESIMESSKEHVQRIRGVLKYLLGIVKTLKQTGEEEEMSALKNMTHLDRFILAKTSEFERNIFAYYDSCQYNRATATILHFMANELSGVYLHLVKDRLYCGTPEDIRTIERVVQRVTQALLTTIWPINCHLAEEAFRYICEERPFWSGQVDGGCEVGDPEEVQRSVIVMEKLLGIKKLVDKANVEKVNSWNLNVLIKAPKGYEDLKVRVGIKIFGVCLLENYLSFAGTGSVVHQ